MRDKYDILVVGCGLAGLTQSLLLAREGFSVACIGMMPAQTDKRTTAISYGSHLVLKQAGVWGALIDDACPIKDIHILDGNSFVLLDFDSQQDHDTPAFGWIIENNDLFSALINAAEKNKNVDLNTNMNVSDIEYCDTHVSVKLDNNKQIETRLIIGADGRRSFVRENVNIQSKKWDYNQTAIVCFITHENPHDNIAIEHFYSSGPYAVLPINDESGKHRSSIVWTLERKDIDTMLNDTALLKTALQERLPAFYGDIDAVTDIQAYPLAFNHAYDYVGHRMALVADAAHGIHPIAGQGLNLGLQDVAILTETLAKAYNDNKDIGLIETLKKYEVIRLPENIKMAAATDLLNKLFSTDNKVVSLMRKKGLKIVQNLSPVKKFFSKTAMGLKS